MSFPGECDVARINQDDVEVVRERTDIVALIQQYVGLKKQGRAFSGLCPFHTEKTPSFAVDPAKQLYHCYGCQAGGNAFNFLMGVESLTFPEAVERLAKQAGINLRYEGRSPEDRKAASRRQSLFRANARAADLYHRHLMDHRDAGEARRYLEARGIPKETAVEFGIGYAPGFPDFLLRQLAREFSPEILVEAGLALKDSSGSVRDRFRNRVTFPVNDLAGQAVGFGARLLTGEGPKYLNSPETPVYKKGEMLYNLHRAKAQVTDGGRAYVVEGYTDVIALHQGGAPTAVATCGTALSEGHLRLLSRFARQAVLAFDSDEAGARAAERAYGFMTQHAVEIRVLVLPEGLDPADFVQARGADAFKEMAEQAVPLVEYMIRRRLRTQDLRSPEGQARAVRETLPIVSGLDDPVLRSQYAGVLAELVEVKVDKVLEELEWSPRGATGNGEQAGVPRKSPEVRVPSREVEKEALKLLMQFPDLAGDRLDALDDDHFTKESHRKVLALLRKSAGQAPAEVIGRLQEERMARFLAELAVEPLKGEVGKEYAERVFSRLEEFFLSRRIDIMKKRLERINPLTESTSFDSLYGELIALEGERRKVRARTGEGT
jgi:DNA primase